ncbi:MAG: DUF2065 domain-containing protein [Gammaproteobacteria bacterium]
MTSQLFAALGLVLVLEGILPFLSPAALRRTLHQIGQLDDRSLRIIGLASMLSGALLVYLAR